MKTLNQDTDEGVESLLILFTHEEPGELRDDSELFFIIKSNSKSCTYK
jgi:hypothetical protein